MLFSTKSVLRRDKSASQMKSLRDEIAFGGYKDGFNFFEAEGFDFIQICLDFIVNKVSDFIIETLKVM